MKTKDITRSIKPDNARASQRALDACILAVILTLLVEGLNQCTVPRMLTYITRRPLCLLLNFLVIFTSLCFSELFPQRRAVLFTESLVWLGFGIANHICCITRTLPLTFGDLILTREVLELATIYFKWYEIVGMIIAGIGMIAMFVIAYTRSPHRVLIGYPRSLAFVCLLTLGVYGLFVVLRFTNLLPNAAKDVVYVYRDYGFSTSFLLKAGSLGIDRPEDYSPDTVVDIIENILPDEEESDTAEFSPSGLPMVPAALADTRYPNLVFIQLESFADVSTWNNVVLDGDPIPNWHAALSRSPNAKLYVPTIGGGTANVEFEIMSGMNMDFFGAGETPYDTIIQKVTCETIANILRDYGYVSTALHDNTGTFYSRNTVYANLGFERFIPLEYMLQPRYTEMGWCRDITLTREIMESLSSTEGRDLLFAIAVESHGKYADTYDYREEDVHVLSLPEHMDLAPTQNYINLISSVDVFLGEILDSLDAWNEPVIAVIYGDHLPGLGLETDMLSTGDFYSSHYILWSNYDADLTARDIQSYQLSAYLFQQLGLPGGIMNSFHQSHEWDEDSDEFFENMQTLEYDMLYGDQNSYRTYGPYEATDIQLGIEPIRPDSARLEYNRLLVTGDRFTPYSQIQIGDTLIDTVYIDRHSIVCPMEAEDLPEGELCIMQITPDGQELGKTVCIPIEIQE